MADWTKRHHKETTTMLTKYLFFFFFKLEYLSINSANSFLNGLSLSALHCKEDFLNNYTKYLLGAELRTAWR